MSEKKCQWFYCEVNKYTSQLTRSVRDRWRVLAYAHVFAQSSPIIRRVRTGLFVNLVLVSRANRTTLCNRQRRIFKVEMLKRLKRTVHYVRPDIADVWKLMKKRRTTLPSWPIQMCQQLSNRPTVLAWHYPTSCFCGWKLTWKDIILGQLLKSNRLARRLQRIFLKGLPLRLRTLKMSLEAMYKRRRRLFWNLSMYSTDRTNKNFLIDSPTLLFGQTLVYIISRWNNFWTSTPF